MDKTLLTRRSAVALAIASLAAACTTQAVTTKPSATPVAAPDPNAVSAASSLQSIASGVEGMLTKFGVSTATVAQIHDIDTKLFGIADQVSKAGSGVNWKSWVNDGLNLVAMLAPLVPGGQLVGAIAAVAQEAAQVAGLTSSAAHRLGRATMSPVQARAVLAAASRGQL